MGRLTPPSSEAGTAAAAVRPGANAAVGAVGPRSTTADWPDSSTEPGEAADVATNALCAAGCTSLKDERAADSQKATDQLTTAESLAARQAPIPDTLRTMRLKPADSLAADQSRPTDSLAAGSALTSNMLAASQQTQAGSSAADRSADSMTAALPLAIDMLVAGQQAQAEDSLAGEQPQAAESLKAGQAQAADSLVSGQVEAGQAEKKALPVILILCGVPGSGKSTFCAQLIARGQASWVRVNQDSINNGRQADSSCDAQSAVLTCAA